METEKKRLTSAIDVLQSLFERGNSPLAGQYIRWRLEQNWVEVAGETIAANSRPANYIKQTLYLGVNHPAWIQHIKFTERELIRAINSFVGKPYAKEIKCFVEGNEHQGFLGKKKG